MRSYGYYANNVFGPHYSSFDYIGAGKHLSNLIAAGYGVCFFVLMAFGFYHGAAKRWSSAYVSYILAALSVVDLMIMPFSIFAVATS